MYLREADQSAYKKVLFFEILLRRVIRWEARGARGRQWLGAFGELHDRIEDRIQSERRSGSFNSHSSELSYLSLSELFEIVFDCLWEECFQQVLSNKRHIRINPCRGLNAVRNKVAHFRPVDENDRKALSNAEYLFEALGSYYRNHLKARAYIPGDFDRADDQLNDEELGKLSAYLGGHGADSVWDEFQRLDSVRAYGMSPGIGVVSHHVFYELYTKGAFGASRLVDCLERNKQEITFMNVGITASYVRIFMPIKIGAPDILKVMKKITVAARESLEDPPHIPADVIREFDLGYFESLGADQTNLYFGFVF